MKGIIQNKIKIIIKVKKSENIINIKKNKI
jgi:hypothetical protein